jgi:hypothetical protein
MFKNLILSYSSNDSLLGFFTSCSTMSLYRHVKETCHQVSGWLNFVQVKKNQSLWIQRQQASQKVGGWGDHYVTQRTNPSVCHCNTCWQNLKTYSCFIFNQSHFFCIQVLCSSLEYEATALRKLMFCLFLSKHLSIFRAFSSPVKSYLDSAIKDIAWNRGTFQNLTVVY